MSLIICNLSLTVFIYSVIVIILYLRTKVDKIKDLGIVLITDLNLTNISMKKLIKHIRC